MGSLDEGLLDLFHSVFFISVHNYIACAPRPILSWSLSSPFQGEIPPEDGGQSRDSASAWRPGDGLVGA